MERIVSGGTRFTGSGGIMNAELLQTSTFLNVLIQYVGGARSTSELEEWLVGNLQSFLDSTDEGAIELVNQVDALFVEMSEGLISEDQLRNSILTILALNESPLASDSSASTNTVFFPEPIRLTPSVFIQVKHSFAPAAASK
jgi:hypothetical protein